MWRSFDCADVTACTPIRCATSSRVSNTFFMANEWCVWCLRCQYVDAASKERAHVGVGGHAERGAIASSAVAEEVIVGGKLEAAAAA